MKKKVLSQVAFWSIAVLALVLLVLPTQELQAIDANTNPKGPTEHMGDTITCYNTASYNCRIIQLPGQTVFVIVLNQDKDR